MKAGETKTWALSFVAAPGRRIAKDARHLGATSLDPAKICLHRSTAVAAGVLANENASLDHALNSQQSKAMRIAIFEAFMAVLHALPRIRHAA
jgi:hypothetical protein